MRSCNRAWEGDTEGWTRVGPWSEVGKFWIYSEVEEEVLLRGQMKR